MAKAHENLALTDHDPAAHKIGTPKERARWLRDKKLVKKLHEDDIDVDLLLGNKNELPKLTCRQKLLEALHKPVAQLLLALLMLIDSGIIVAEIVVEVKKFVAETQQRELDITLLARWIIDYVPPVKHRWNPSHNGSFEAEQRGAFAAFLVGIANNFTSSSSCYGNAKEKSKGHEVDSLEMKMEKKEKEIEHYETIIEVLAITSIVVLGLFVIEVTVKFIAMGAKKFCRSKLEIIDAIIIFASFSVDLGTFLSDDRSPETSVMIVLLIWRIVRLINGFLMHEKQTAEAHNHIMQKIHQLMVLEVKYLKAKNHNFEEKLERAKEVCRNYRVPAEEMEQLEVEEVAPHDLIDSRAHHDNEPKRFPHNITMWFTDHSTARKSSSPEFHAE